MISLASIRLVAATVLLLDAAIGLCALDYWQRLVPSINLRRVIAIETLAAAALLAMHAILA